MFDDLRERSMSPFDEEEPDFEDEFELLEEPEGFERPIFGLTAIQRLVLTVMLFLNVSVLGCVCLLAAQRVVPLP